MTVEPGCLAMFIGCRRKDGGWQGECEVLVGHGPWRSKGPCLHCGSHNLLWAVDGIPGADGCCLCRLRRIDGPKLARDPCRVTAIGKAIAALPESEV